MSIVSATLHWSGATGSRKRGAKEEYTAVWRVVTNDFLDNAGTIIAYFQANGPFINDAYAYGNDRSNNATCDSIDPTRSNNSNLHWEVRFHYSTPDETESGKDENGNETDDPLKFYDEVEINSIDVVRPLETAIYRQGLKGTAAARTKKNSEVVPSNSVGIPFNPPDERFGVQFQIKITKTEASYPSELANLYHRAINNQAFTIRKRFQRFVHKIGRFDAQFVRVAGSFRISNGFRYWRNVYEILHDPEYGFRAKYIDRGLSVRAAAGDPDGRGGIISPSDIVEGVPQIRRLVDADETPISEPLLLNGDGQLLPAGEKPVRLVHSKHPELDFRKLRL